MDAPSLALLEFLAAQLAGMRVLVVGAHRDIDVAPDAPGRDDLARLARLATTIGLGGLDQHACRELIEDTAGVPVGAAVAAGMLARASAIGPEFDAQLLAAAAGADVPEVVAVLAGAVDAGVLFVPDAGRTVYRFAHPLLREAVYADLPIAARATIHERIGNALEALSDHAGERTSALAHHFRLAVPVSGASQALRYGQLAARRAMDLLAYEQAALHLEHVLGMHDAGGGTASDRAELLLELGEARMRAGDWPGAVSAYEQAARSARQRGDTVQLARAALGMGAGLIGFEVRLADRRQLDLLEEAAGSLTGESSLRALVLARLSVASTLQRTAEERARLSRDAIALARRVLDPQELAYALSAYCDALSGAAHSEERLERAGEMIALAAGCGSHETELLGRRFRIVALLEQGDFAGVDAEIAAYERVAATLRQPLYRWYVPLWKGMRALTEGRLADAAAGLDEAETIGEQAHGRNAAILTTMLRLWLLAEHGLVDEACQRLEEVVAADPEAGVNASLFQVRLRAEADGRRRRARCCPG